MKKVTSLSLGFSFLIMSYTGVVLFIAPHGRVARWLDWHFLGLDKTQYQELHTTSMITFLVFGLLHIYYNWKPIISYLKDQNHKISFTKKEFLIAFLLNIVFVIGTIYLTPPFKSFLDFGENIKESWGEKSTKTSKIVSSNDEEVIVKAPPERLGQKTLQHLNDNGYINLNKSIKILNSKGLNSVDSNTKIRFIADELDMTPSDIYGILTQ